MKLGIDAKLNPQESYQGDRDPIPEEGGEIVEIIAQEVILQPVSSRRGKYDACRKHAQKSKFLFLGLVLTLAHKNIIIRNDGDSLIILAWRG